MHSMLHQINCDDIIQSQTISIFIQWISSFDLSRTTILDREHSQNEQYKEEDILL